MTKIGSEVAYTSHVTRTPLSMSKGQANLLLMSYIANMPEHVPSGE